MVKYIIKIFKQKKIIIGNKAKIIFVKDRPGHDFRYALDSRKIFKKIKWKSRINVKKGLSETIDWYLNNKKFLDNISKKNYEKRLGLKL